ncbi:T9SS type A sorting domain-containing protein [Marixanthomonas sp. SCSIO 43207]|uniref:T9SS type A sorting domain-containing protein n=1 Tax=Marixanthomonas sp. SCSIO 43207 TaxID=2779360 RepID=UPI001CA8FB30|nr:T9SS type A sorting domain-containing protein [Marixanthomonas sp. SCSIO 43207]UAB82000.1 T9SS type A sorting domain-containing protein [Marixanthomonas sp. SCSIO 43207]
MRRLLLFLFLMFTTIGFSQCEVNQYIQDNYLEDAWIMVFRDFVDNPNHPDYDVPILDANKTIPYLGKLSAVYELAADNETADSLFNKLSIHANTHFPNMVVFEEIIITVPESTPWVIDFIDTGVSNVPELDMLIEDYQFNITDVAIIDPPFPPEPAVYDITIHSDISFLNPYALLDEFEAITGVDYAEVGTAKTPYNYTGIPFEIDGEEVRSGNIFLNDDTLLFSLYTGDCWYGGCTSDKNWETVISEDCSQVDIQLNTTNFNPLSYSIYPNPATDYLYLKGLPLNKASIKIYSTQGRVLKQFKNTPEKINVSTFVSGMYFISIETKGKERSIKRFIKK